MIFLVSEIGIFGRLGGPRDIGDHIVGCGGLAPAFIKCLTSDVSEAPRPRREKFQTLRIL